MTTIACAKLELASSRQCLLWPRVLARFESFDIHMALSFWDPFDRPLPQLLPALFSFSPTWIVV